MQLFLVFSAWWTRLCVSLVNTPPYPLLEEEWEAMQKQEPEEQQEEQVQPKQPLVYQLAQPTGLSAYSSARPTWARHLVAE